MVRAAVKALPLLVGIYKCRWQPGGSAATGAQARVAPTCAGVLLPIFAILFGEFTGARRELV
jgi:hypothetical protein